MLTAEEYLERDRAAEFRSEYYDGEMYARPGGTFSSALLAGRIIAGLAPALAGRPCHIATSVARVRVSATTYVYPDVTVVCGKPELAGSDTLLNPTLIVEVLSESSERFDRGVKFWRYRRIDSLQEYVLVSQSEPRVDVLTRQPDGSWNLHEYSGLDSVAHLRGIGVSLSLKNLFQDVEMTGSPEALVSPGG